MSAYYSRITIESPFPRIDLPSLHCWQERIWPSIHDDTVPTKLEEWMDHQLDRMSADLVQTWAVSKDRIIGGYVESAVCISGPPLPRDSVQMAMTFRRDLWGLANTGPALRLVLQEVFSSGVEMTLFPLFTDNQPIKDLLKTVGASSIGVVDTERLRNGQPVDTEIFALPLAEWERKNAAFIAEYEAAHPVETLELAEVANG